MNRKNQPRSPQHLRTLSLLAFLLVACSLILWHAWNQYQTTEQEKYALLTTAIDGSAHELSMHVQNQQQHLDLLVDNQRRLIQRLVDSPLDHELSDTLLQRFKQAYPDLIDLSLADSSGHLMLDDPQNRIRRHDHDQLLAFAKTREHTAIFFDANQPQNNYSLLSRIPVHGYRFVILYLSFQPDSIVQLLRHAA